MACAEPRVTLAVAETSLLGESPLWHPDEAALYWCDIPGKALRRWHPATGKQHRWTFDCEPACVARLSPALGLGERQLLLAMRDGLWRFDPDTGQRHSLAPAPYNPSQERFNDGKCGPDGRFWVGTIYEPRHPPLASLHVLGRDGLRRDVDGVTVSNGLAWSPDGQTQYWTDTTSHTIFARPVDPATGEPGERRVFKSFPMKQPQQDLNTYGGRPDGAAVDVEGAYWAAMFEGQRLVRLSPQGDELASVTLPVRCPTMLCFGGEDMRTVYVTTACDNRPEQELLAQPWSGAVLQFRVDVPGVPIPAVGVLPS